MGDPLISIDVSALPTCTLLHMCMYMHTPYTVHVHGHTDRFLEKYFYNSRSGKSCLSFYNFGMELLTNISLVSLKNSLT